jgi:hypothetical protein
MESKWLRHYVSHHMRLTVIEDEVLRITLDSNREEEKATRKK